MAAAAASFFGIRDDEDRPHDEMQSQLQSSSPPPTTSATAAPPAAPPKKRRNQPGTTYPDAEVIALSPKSLLATNRFVCEVCNKGFQREQNLQLHRRGHNLPWKLRQKSKDVQPRRKVYLCPEPSCAHHDPSRALGDLTGIKKHFCRKHGEKKWKCDKCSKRYAVQSDWKAHSKTCGTREYRCDCGTIFSRRDSFVTHRAFCDALAQESARLPTSLSSIGNQLYRNSNMSLSLSQLNSQLSSLQEPTHPSADLLRLGGGPAVTSHFDHLLPPPTHSTQAPPSSAAFFLGAGSSQDFTEEPQTHHSFLESKPFHGLMPLPDLPSSAAAPTAATAANLFNLGFGTQNAGHHLLFPGQFNSSNGGGGPTTLFSGNLLSYNSSLQSEPALPQMSATALLQKAAQMGSTSTGGDSSMLRGIGGSSSADVKLSNFHSNYNSGEGFNETHLRNLMNSLANGGSSLFESSGCASGFSGGLHGGMAASALGGGDGLTRDFLGVGSMVSALSQSEGHHGIGIGAFDPDYSLQEESYSKRRKL